MNMIKTQAVEQARSWIGTPYRHQARTKRAGCDCLGLVRGVYRHLYGDEPVSPPPYSADWAERGHEDTLLLAAQTWLVEIDRSKAEVGDVLVFRFAAGRLAKHCAIISGPGHMIHAWQGQCVCETPIGPGWQRRIAGAFSFPNHRR